MDPTGSAIYPTGPDAQEDARPSGAAVAAIQHVNLPPFWPNSPSTWSLQLEAHFRLRQITSQQTRHWHLVSCLPPDVANDLADILASPHPSHRYDTLKAAIISRKPESEHSRLQQLITATELGDRRPSQLLRRMRQLLGGASAPQEEKLLHELFLQRLPQSMVPVLVAAGDVPVDTLAEMADRVADYSRAHSLNAVTTPPPATAADPALASIENRLDALLRRLDDFVPAHRRPSSRFQIHSRFSTPPRSPELWPPDAPRHVSSSTVCWYHRRFGASARKYHGKHYDNFEKIPKLLKIGPSPTQRPQDTVEEHPVTDLTRAQGEAAAQETVNEKLIVLNEFAGRAAGLTSARTQPTDSVKET
ncbi:hypothetical protein HPB51_012115 [Rhipicephalus microplus]|uniref:DUF7041 domain-containing protein n=1 Tax=Rhipicephalus microplus TaxID=6941 RepID=A0A9J6DV37_RHIMP|nr:hypothetical protein HPB51_012115 [Rhipicephalus microplus]